MVSPYISGLYISLLEIIELLLYILYRRFNYYIHTDLWLFINGTSLGKINMHLFMVLYFAIFWISIFFFSQYFLIKRKLKIHETSLFDSDLMFNKEINWELFCLKWQEEWAHNHFIMPCAREAKEVSNFKRVDSIVNVIGIFSLQYETCLHNFLMKEKKLSHLIQVHLCSQIWKIEISFCCIRCGSACWTPFKNGSIVSYSDDFCHNSQKKATC